MRDTLGPGLHGAAGGGGGPESHSKPSGQHRGHIIAALSLPPWDIHPGLVGGPALCVLLWGWPLVGEPWATTLVRLGEGTAETLWHFQSLSLSTDS